MNTEFPIAREQLKDDLMDYITRHNISSEKLLLFFLIKDLESMAMINNYTRSDHALCYWHDNQYLIDEYYEGIIFKTDKGYRRTDRKIATRITFINDETDELSIE
jgi:hypothetical protein